MSQVTSKQPGRVIASNVSVSVAGSGNTDLLEVPCEDIDQLGIELSVVTQNLDAFVMQARMSPDGTYQTVKSTGWDTVSGILLATSGDLAALAAAAKGFAVVDVRGFYSVKFLASAAANSAVVTTRAIGKGHRV